MEVYYIVNNKILTLSNFTHHYTMGPSPLGNEFFNLLPPFWEIPYSSPPLNNQGKIAQDIMDR